MSDISTDSTEAIEDEATEAVVEPLVGTIEVNSERYEFEFEDDDEPAYVESPYDRPGRWYVVHTYSGYENKVRDNILRLIQNRELEEKIYEVVIPMEQVFDFKAGRKVEVEKKVFPGYLLVRSDLDDETWAAIRS
ncbi:MAG: transcription termination/antitermination NusG family protein, partial [Actinomycetes bacterium]